MEFREDIDYVINAIINSIDSVLRDKHSSRMIPGRVRDYLRVLHDLLKSLRDDEILHPLDKLMILFSILLPKQLYGLADDPQIHALGYILRSLRPNPRREIIRRLNRLLKLLNSLDTVYGESLNYIENHDTIRIISMGIHVDKQLSPSTYLGRDFQGSVVVAKIIDRCSIDVETIYMLKDVVETGIPRIHVVEEYGDKIIVVREYIDGQPLPQVLDKLLSDRRLGLWVLHDILEILSRIYGKYGILHHDLKPDNIVVDRKWRVYVIDWIYSAPPGKLDVQPYYSVCQEQYDRLMKLPGIKDKLSREPSKYQEIYYELCSIACIGWRIRNGLEYSPSRSLIPYLKDPLNKLLANILGHKPECIITVLETHNPFQELYRIIESIIKGTRIEHMCLT